MAQLGSADERGFPTAPSLTLMPTVAGVYRSMTPAMPVTRWLASTRSRSRTTPPRDRARKRQLNAAKKFTIVPVGFITNQLRSERDLGRRGDETIRLPSGFVTMLLTDIEESTALVRCLGDGYGDLLERVRPVLRDTTLGV
jgi:hypothetical protein